MPVAAAQRDGLARCAAGALINGVAERAGTAQGHAAQDPLFAGRKMGVRSQEAGQELAQHGANVLSGLAAGGKPLAVDAHLGSAREAAL